MRIFVTGATGLIGSKIVKELIGEGHAVANEGVSLQEIAEAIGRRLNLPVKSISTEEAVNHFGPLGQLVAADIPASNALTQERLGWQPKYFALIQDIARV